jgi:hypothetical protein
MIYIIIVKSYTFDTRQRIVGAARCVGAAGANVGSARAEALGAAMG